MHRTVTCIACNVAYCSDCPTDINNCDRCIKRYRLSHGVC